MRQGELFAEPPAAVEPAAGAPKASPAAPRSPAAAPTAPAPLPGPQPVLPGLAPVARRPARVAPKARAPMGRFLQLNGVLDGAVAEPRPWLRLPPWGRTEHRATARFTAPMVMGGRVECP